MKRVIFTDPHITEAYLDKPEELYLIAEEIWNYCKDADEIIMVGDYYDKKRPTAKEIDFGTFFATRLKQTCDNVIFIIGNHDSTEGISAIDYLRWVGIKVGKDYTDSDNNYYGHFMTNKSLMEYGTAYTTVSALKKYNYVILGHQHSFQKLASNIYHLGSVRYCNFNEINDESKKIAIIEDNKLEFIDLISPIPMKDAKTLEELEAFSPNLKVRLCISSFQDFKRFVPELSKYKKKFTTFKTKLDFQKADIKPEVAKTIKTKSFSALLIDELNKIEDKEVQQILREQFKEEGHDN